jgi:hypothetical protein
MAKINATFVEGDRSVTDKVIDWDGQTVWNVPVPVKFETNWNAEPRDMSKLVFPVKVYEHLGKLPNDVHIFGHSGHGLTAWHIDQYFRGPNAKTMQAWQRVLRDADRELHMELVHLSGCPTWPNKPQHPPFLTLHQELRFVTDACENHQKPYMYLYHRRSQGVAVKRVM